MGVPEVAVGKCVATHTSRTSSLVISALLPFSGVRQCSRSAIRQDWWSTRNPSIHYLTTTSHAADLQLQVQECGRHLSKPVHPTQAPFSLPHRLTGAAPHDLGLEEISNTGVRSKCRLERIATGTFETSRSRRSIAKSDADRLISSLPSLHLVSRRERLQAYIDTITSYVHTPALYFCPRRIFRSTFNATCIVRRHHPPHSHGI